MGNQLAFPVGSVGHSLVQMCGVWHDHIELFTLTGVPLEHDPWGGAPGDAPFDNLVYIDFDGELYCQTNVTFAGRPFHARSFTARLREGVLYFDKLGPEAPQHIGVSGGAGVLWFLAANNMDEPLARYSEPDCITLDGFNRRTRMTVLYRQGTAVRTLTARGTKLSPFTSHRHPLDPRGADGPVHENRSTTYVYSGKL
jgi:hypothetical protein